MRKVMDVDDLISSFEHEGTDYALLYYWSLEDFKSLDGELGDLVEEYRRWKTKILERIAELDPDFSPEDWE